MKNLKIFFWACDYKSSSGEGRLARLFIKEFKKKQNYKLIKIRKPKFKFLRHKYIEPFIGILVAWDFFLKKENFLFVNYLPLWNFLIFLFLPPGTLIGPITGGANFKNSFFRKLFFPLFYSISQIAIYFRYNNIIFSTDLLKERLFNFIKKKSQFNFVLLALKKKNFKKKDIDFLIYYRKHNNKKKFFPTFLIKKLIKLNFKILVVGDRLNIKGVLNLGLINNIKLNSYLSRTHFSIASGENLLSFFTIDCINNNVKILMNTNQEIKDKGIKNNFLKVNYKSDNIKKYLKF